MANLILIVQLLLVKANLVLSLVVNYFHKGVQVEIILKIFKINKLMKFNKIETINQIKSVKAKKMKCHHFRLLNLVWD